MDNTQNVSQVQKFIKQEQIPPGGILPRHLAVSTTMKAGDIYYVGANGIFVRLPVGTVGKVLTIQSTGLPGWS